MERHWTRWGKGHLRQQHLTLSQVIMNRLKVGQIDPHAIRPNDQLNDQCYLLSRQCIDTHSVDDVSLSVLFAVCLSSNNISYIFFDYQPNHYKFGWMHVIIVKRKIIVKMMVIVLTLNLVGHRHHVIFMLRSLQQRLLRQDDRQMSLRRQDLLGVLL